MFLGWRLLTLKWDIGFRIESSRRNNVLDLQHVQEVESLSRRDWTETGDCTRRLILDRVRFRAALRFIAAANSCSAAGWKTGIIS